VNISQQQQASRQLMFVGIGQAMLGVGLGVAPLVRRFRISHLWFF